MPENRNARRQTDKGADEPPIKTVHSYASYLTASFRALTETNAGTLAAAILISFTGLWVTASALSIMVHSEGTETNQLYSIAFFQRLGNSSQRDSRAALALVLDTVLLCLQLHQRS